MGRGRPRKRKIETDEAIARETAPNKIAKNEILAKKIKASKLETKNSGPKGAGRKRKVKREVDTNSIVTDIKGEASPNVIETKESAKTVLETNGTGSNRNGSAGSESTLTESTSMNSDSEEGSSNKCTNNGITNEKSDGLPDSDSSYSQVYNRLHNYVCFDNKEDFIVKCREHESNIIHKYLDEKVNGHKLLYIYGPPGTGKTLSVKCALSSQTGSEAVYFNCMMGRFFNSSTLFYSFILKRLKKSNIPSEMPLSDAVLKISSEKKICFIADEVDSIKSNDRSNLLKVFHDISLHGINMNFIFISNNFTFFKSEEIKRYNIERLNFRSYTASQLEIILMHLFEGLEKHVDIMAIKLCAKKVASTTGDIRRAISILKSALERSEFTDTLHITIKDVSFITEKIYGSKMKKIESNNEVNFLPLQQSLLLCCAYKIRKNSQKSNSIDPNTLYDVYKSTCKEHILDCCTFEDMSHLLSLMQSRGFLVHKTDRKTNKQNIWLLVSEEEIYKTMCDKVLLNALL